MKNNHYLKTFLKGKNLSNLFKKQNIRWLLLFVFSDTVATMPQFLCQGWLVLELTDSPFWVGIVYGIEGLVLLFCGGWVGVLSSRVDKKTTLTATQILLSIPALLTALLIYLNELKLWHLFILSLGSGFGHCINMNIAISLFNESVGKKQLMSGTSLRSLVFNLGNIIGSTLIGLSIKNFGIGVSYALLCVPRILSVIAIQKTHKKHRYNLKLKKRLKLRFSLLIQSFKQYTKKDWPALIHALFYGMKITRVRILLLISVAMEFFVFSSLAMLPVVARDVLKVDASALGLLSAAVSAGSLIAGIVVANSVSLPPKGTLITLVSSAAGIALILFSQSNWFAVSLLLATTLGAAMLIYDSTLFTLIQVTVPNSLRERTLGLLIQTFGFNSIGSILAGTTALFLGAPLALTISGVAIGTFSLTLIKSKRKIWNTL